jgi:hypothetical protein
MSVLPVFGFAVVPLVPHAGTRPKLGTRVALRVALLCAMITSMLAIANSIDQFAERPTHAQLRRRLCLFSNR